MKRCPECRRDYTDETLNYCLADGAALLEGPGTDEAVTAVLRGEALSGDTSTRIYDKPSETVRQRPARDTSPVDLRAGRKWLIPLIAVLLGLGAIALYVAVIKDKAA